MIRIIPRLSNTQALQRNRHRLPDKSTEIQIRQHPLLAPIQPSKQPSGVHTTTGVGRCPQLAFDLCNVDHGGGGGQRHCTTTGGGGVVRGVRGGRGGHGGRICCRMAHGVLCHQAGLVQTEGRVQPTRHVFPHRTAPTIAVAVAVAVVVAVVAVVAVAVVVRQQDKQFHGCFLETLIIQTALPVATAAPGAGERHVSAGARFVRVQLTLLLLQRTHKHVVHRVPGQLWRWSLVTVVVWWARLLLQQKTDVPCKINKADPRHSSLGGRRRGRRRFYVVVVTAAVVVVAGGRQMHRRIKGPRVMVEKFTHNG